MSGLCLNLKLGYRFCSKETNGTSENEVTSEEGRSPRLARLTSVAEFRREPVKCGLDSG